jgi:5-methylcytosine-specific restriction protein A
MESVGATCNNWTTSWSFVNHDEKFVVFGQWDIHKDGLILNTKWSGPGKKQALEHIQLVESGEYQLKTFPMQHEVSESGSAKIKGFEPILEDKNLIFVGESWYALNKYLIEEMPTAEEVIKPELYIEGATKRISVNSYERNPKARAKCIEHYGCRCYVCKFDFQKAYGEVGKNFIHVHHEVSLSKIRNEYEVDPLNDLKPVCPNCHGIIHRTQPALPINELIELLKKQSK